MGSEALVILVEHQSIAGPVADREILEHARGNDVEPPPADAKDVITQQIRIGDHDDPPLSEAEAGRCRRRWAARRVARLRVVQRSREDDGTIGSRTRPQDTPEADRLISP